MTITLLYRDVETFAIVAEETFDCWADVEEATDDAKNSGFIPEVRLD
jgi:hypothetical protein